MVPFLYCIVLIQDFGVRAPSFKIDMQSTKSYLILKFTSKQWLKLKIRFLTNYEIFLCNDHFLKFNNCYSNINLPQQNLKSF
jgi:hypothetical protein